MDLTKLCFEGYHYDSNTVSKVDSVFYVKDDNEDDWIEIIPLSNSKEFPEEKFLILYIKDGKIMIESESGMNFDITQQFLSGLIPNDLIF